MTKFSFPAIRYASDMPFAAGMVLADEQGRTVEITAVGTHIAVTGFGTSLVHQVIRQVYPYLVFVTELVADAERAEAERIEALAEAAQYEDDLKDMIGERAATEWARKNPGHKPIAFAIPESPKRQLPTIVTSFVYPPIPIRSNDWCAFRDGHEEDGNYGWGRTEADAVADLLAIEADAD